MHQHISTKLQSTMNSGKWPTPPWPTHISVERVSIAYMHAIRSSNETFASSSESSDILSSATWRDLDHWVHDVSPTLSYVFSHHTRMLVLKVPNFWAPISPTKFCHPRVCSPFSNHNHVAIELSTDCYHYIRWSGRNIFDPIHHTIPQRTASSGPPDET